jgi:hypothetical protein
MPIVLPDKSRPALTESTSGPRLVSVGRKFTATRQIAKISHRDEAAELRERVVGMAFSVERAGGGVVMVDIVAD